MAKMIRGIVLCVLWLLPFGSAQAAPITLNAYADDYGVFSVDGTVIGSYDNPAAAGNIIRTLDLTAGWHDVSFVYRNRAGTNFLGFTWMLPTDSGFTTIPAANLRSVGSAGGFVQGLRGDYYTLGGAFQFSVFGEGPIQHGALSFSQEIYQGVNGLWAGVYGPSAQFEERLTGQFLVPAVPEPSTALLFGLGIVVSVVWLGRRRIAARVV